MPFDAGLKGFEFIRCAIIGKINPFIRSGGMQVGHDIGFASALCKPKEVGFILLFDRAMYPALGPCQEHGGKCDRA